MARDRPLGRYRRMRSMPTDVEYSLGKGLRSFLRQIVPNAAGDDSMLIRAGEFATIGAAFGMWRAIGVTFQRDGWHSDDRASRQPLFQFVVAGFALRQPQPPAVIVDHDTDVIGVVEG